MTVRFPVEQLADLCEHARILVQRAAHHRNDLQALVATAETEVRHAETALTYALGEADVAASRLRSLLSSQLQQSVRGVEAARQLCIGAAQQHVVAARLLALLTAYEMRPAVIVMDVTMPVLDGLDATRLIKAIDATRHARVIAYTGDAALDDTPLRTLFAAVVRKPALPSVVLATVRRVANS